MPVTVAGMAKSPIKGVEEKTIVKKWTQEQAIGYECACECIADLIAIKQAEIYAEESSISPNEDRISGLRNEVGTLWRERQHLSVHDAAEIARIQTEYGAQVLAYRSGATA